MCQIDISLDAFFFQAEDGIRDATVTGVQTCALPIFGLAVGCGLSLGAILLAGTLHRKIGHRLPRAVDRFFAGAWAPPKVLAKAGAILLATWVVRLFAIMLMLHSLGIRAG